MSDDFAFEDVQISLSFRGEMHESKLFAITLSFTPPFEGFAVTHAPSGFGITTGITREQAMAIIRTLVDGGNAIWESHDAEEIGASKRARQLAEQACGDVGAILGIQRIQMCRDCVAPAVEQAQDTKAGGVAPFCAEHGPRWFCDNAEGCAGHPIHTDVPCAPGNDVERIEV